MKLETIIVGGGPAGLSFLLAARMNGTLLGLIESGLKVLESSGSIGAGELGRYRIRSDSFANSFLTSAESEGEPSLSVALSKPAGIEMVAAKGRPVELGLASQFTRDVGDEFVDWDCRQGHGLFECHTTVEVVRKLDDGSYEVVCESPEKGRYSIFCNNVILATGADQQPETFSQAPTFGVTLNDQYQHKLVGSKRYLSHEGKLEFLSGLSGKSSIKVAILGGSHSALSCLKKCLDDLAESNITDSEITLIHRNKLTVTYADPEAAKNDGFSDFDDDDICPRSGRVFPLAGFRCDSRDLMRKLWGAEPSDISNVTLLKDDGDSTAEIRHILNESDVIVAALGYRPRAVKLVDEKDLQIRLRSDLEQKSALVDEQSRVLDADGEVVANLYALGLSVGYPLTGRYGEPSFKGEANGLALWQTDIGHEILAQIL